MDPFKKGQAAVELAVFGAILVFILGTIVRSAVGNSYTQEHNFKAMRMAMLESWQGSDAAKGLAGVPQISHNSASVLFIEDRLSPDINKYGSLERNPFIANGAGTFSYELNYPLDKGEVSLNLPVMDVYINGQHFPFTTASYVANRPITRPASCNYPAGSCSQNQCLRNQREWVTDPSDSTKKYKLFYTMIPSNGDSRFSVIPPVCADPNNVKCKDKALSLSLPLPDGSGAFNNGEMQYDLLRNGNYAAVDSQFPAAPPALMRKNISWQWAATLGTVQGDTTDGADPMIGLDPDNNQFPSYDIDGRLKEVTIYGISQNSDGSPTVTYEDNQGGDIDSSWDTNSCGPKPGLQSDSHILTFTSICPSDGSSCPAFGRCADGSACQPTYLQVKEGKMYNPETGQEVRSVSRRSNVDLIERRIQLSNNTGRFCNGAMPQPCVANCTTPSNCSCPALADPSFVPNPVEVCVDGNTCNCFMGSTANGPTNPACGNTIAETCFDASNNLIYVRSRLQDRRGNAWMTNASGQLKVQ